MIALWIVAMCDGDGTAGDLEFGIIAWVRIFVSFAFL